MAHIKGTGPLTAEELKKIQAGDTVELSRLPQNRKGWQAIMATPPPGSVYSGPVIQIEGSDARIQSVPSWV